ncbi:MAG: hypothetical protein K2F99_09050 [Muribaculaceae bacterium]|nr:hypothetical protein [Bacteroidales bacterium]MDE6041708.1 hypothetical protein [Muribaculaceae bacterium]
MKKTILFVIIFVALLVCAVGYSDSKYRTAVGQPAPLIAIGQADSLVKIDELRGNFVLLSFWSAANAPSRAAVNLYTAWQRQNPGKNLQLVNINFDDSRNIYEDIVERDGLNPNDNFYAEGAQAKAIIDNYGLNDGFGSVLINSHGKIVAHNPSAKQLEQMIK